jgi:hypothetical protein
VSGSTVIVTTTTLEILDGAGDTQQVQVGATAAGVLIPFQVMTISGVPISAEAPMPVVNGPIGLGSMTALPFPTEVGTPLGTLPENAQGARFYLPAGTSVTFTIASAQPTAAPTAAFETPIGSASANWDEPLAAGQMIYVTAVTGSPFFRWI